jgi:hypothetical protein
MYKIFSQLNIFIDGKSHKQKIPWPSQEGEKYIEYNWFRQKAIYFKGEKVLTTEAILSYIKEEDTFFDFESGERIPFNPREDFLRDFVKGGNDVSYEKGYLNEIDLDNLSLLEFNPIKQEDCHLFCNEFIYYKEGHTFDSHFTLCEGIAYYNAEIFHHSWLVNSDNEIFDIIAWVNNWDKSDLGYYGIIFDKDISEASDDDLDNYFDILHVPKLGEYFEICQKLNI